jgi:hypothetical protein
MALFCKKITDAKFEEVKTGCNLAESSKRGCDDESAIWK